MKATRKRRRKRPLILAGFVVVILGGGLLYLRSRLSDLVHSAVKAAQSDLGLFSLELGDVREIGLIGVEVIDARLLDEDGDVVIEAEEIEATMSLSSIFSWQAEEIEVTGLTVRLERGSDGRWNLPLGDGDDGQVEDVIPASESEKVNVSFPVRHVRLVDAKILFTDDTLFQPGTVQEMTLPEMTVDLFRGGRIELRPTTLEVGGVGPIRFERLYFEVAEERVGGRVTIEKVTLEESTAGYLPKGAASDIWELLRPAGIVGLEADIDMDLDGGMQEIEGSVKLSDLSIDCVNFPYPIRNLSGTIDIRGDRAEIRIDGKFRDATLQIWGSVESIWSDPSVHLEARISDVVVDAELERAFDAAGLGGVFDLLQPSGRFGLTEITLDKVAGVDELLISIRAEPEGVDVVFRSFPYRVENVNAGMLLVQVRLPTGGDSRQPEIKVTLEDLNGHHDGSRIIASGGWSKLPGGSKLDFRFEAKEIDLAPDLSEALMALDAGFLPIWEELSPTGQVNAEVLLKRGVDGILRYEVVADFLGSSVRGYPVDDLTGRLRLTNEILEFSDVKARHGEGRWSGSGKGEFKEDGISARILVAWEKIPLDEHLRRLLPSEEIRNIYDQFQPEGFAGGNLALRIKAGSGAVELESLTVMPGGAQVQYEAFPYPVQIQSGEIRVLPGKIHIDVTGQLANNGFLGLKGDVIKDGEELEIELSATWTGLRLDETLKEVLPPEALNVWDQIGPGGVIDGDLKLTQHGEGPLDLQGEVRLQSATCTPSVFPVEVRELRGSILCDVRIEQDGATVGSIALGEVGGARITGLIEESPISAYGHVHFGEGTNELDLRFTARDLVLDRRLVDALPGEVGEPIGEFDPNGPMDVDLALWSPPEGELRVDCTATLKGIQVAAPMFTLPIDRLTGTISLRENRLSIEGVRGRHGDAAVRVDGTVLFENEEMDFSIGVERLSLTGDMGQHLPESPSRTWQDLAPRGEIDVEVQLHKDPVLGLLVLGEVEFRDVSLQAVKDDARLEGLSGRIQTLGRIGTDGSIKADGRLVGFEAARKNHRLENLSARFRYGRPGGPGGSAELTVDEIRAEFLGGILEGRARLRMADELSYRGTISLTGGRLELALTELEESRRATGNVSADLIFHGKGNRPETLQGEGEIRIRDGDLGKIPAVSDLLSFLRLESKFDSLDLEAKVEGERVYVEASRLTSPTVSIIGWGHIGFDGSLDLIVAPYFGRKGLRGIPILGDLWGNVVGQFVAVSIRGRKEEPKYEYRPFETVLEAINVFSE
ncbi:MAG: hypothetical protein O7H41_13335 [Planctomycetota bacterium]|nr:hypothetical protein [Planctomycetota bacterium]